VSGWCAFSTSPEYIQNSKQEEKKIALSRISTRMNKDSDTLKTGRDIPFDVTPNDECTV